MIELLLQAERALSVGQLEQAERLYRAGRRGGSAQLDRGRRVWRASRSTGATSAVPITLARRALDIDPENAAAQRLADRLEEVIAYRGEAAGSVDAAPRPVAAPSPGTRTGRAGPEPEPAARPRPRSGRPAAARAEAGGRPAPAPPLAPRPHSPPALTVSSGA